MQSPSILHIDTGKTVRGGQRQLLLLTSRLHGMGIRQATAVPAGCGLRDRLGDIPTLELSPASMIRIIRLSRLKEAVVSHNINIIHAHDSHAHTLGILLKRWNPELKLIVSRRVIFPPSGKASRKFKYGCGVDHYIAISDAVRSSLIEAGIDADRVAVIPSGLEIDKISAVSPDTTFVSSQLPSCAFVVVMAGALTSEKDVGTAIRAFSQAKNTVHDIGLLILGEGSERKRLEQLRDDLGAHHIVFAGHHEPLAPIFKACDLFLMTSTSEGLNTSAIEAAACGLPLIVSDVGGLPEIAEHQYNGLLCPPRDEERFAEAIVELYRDAPRRNEMGKRSAERAMRFDIEETAKKTVDLYKRVLAG